MDKVPVSGCDARVRRWLVCPVCRGELEDVPAGLACPACHLLYPVEDGIPCMTRERSRRWPADEPQR